MNFFLWILSAFGHLGWTLSIFNFYWILRLAVLAQDDISLVLQFTVYRYCLLPTAYSFVMIMQMTGSFLSTSFSLGMISLSSTLQLSSFTKNSSWLRSKPSQM